MEEWNSGYGDARRWYSINFPVTRCTSAGAQNCLTSENVWSLNWPSCNNVLENRHLMTMTAASDYHPSSFRSGKHSNFGRWHQSNEQKHYLTKYLIISYTYTNSVSSNMHYHKVWSYGGSRLGRGYTMKNYLGKSININNGDTFCK